jgi:hypothetical protein
MDNWIIHEIIDGSKRCRIDYESLANLPDLNYSRLGSGAGISITESPDGQQNISVDPEILQKLETLRKQVFPVTITTTAQSGFGVHELGDVVTPSISWRVARETEGEITDTQVTPQSNTGSTWTSPVDAPYSGITTYTWSSPSVNTSYRVIVSSPDFQDLTIGPLTVKFTRYRYYGVLSSHPESITEALVKSLSTSELNDSGTLGNTSLASGKYFLFVVPGVKTLVVRHAGTDGVIDSEKGTIVIHRKNGTDSGSGHSYSWILVPSSSVAWSFKITGS